MQKGIKNEINFKQLLDRKMVKDLPSNLQDMLYALFLDIEPTSIIDCWRSKYLEKADIKIKIHGVIKGISIKTGKDCSMHQEIVSKFYPFLLKIGVDNRIVDEFNNFMLGIIDNQKVGEKTYIANHREKIDIIKEVFNEPYVMINLILRFIFQGTEIQKYDCDAILYGTIDNFLWATKNELLTYLLKYKATNSSGINIGSLTIKNYDRNLRESTKRKNCENSIQVKWPNLKYDLMCIEKLREVNKIRQTKIMHL